MSRTISLDGARVRDVAIESTKRSLGGQTTRTAEAIRPHPWFVLQVQPGRDHYVARQIAHDVAIGGTVLRQAYPVAVLSRTVRNTRHEIVRELVFPSYLLVQFEPIPDRWAPLHFVQGVVRLLSSPDHRPLPLPDGVYESLVKRFAHVPECPLTIGAAVAVTAGPFEGFAGTIEALAPNERVRVLLSVFGRSAAITLPKKQVATA